jgi:SAM-dependent methyltransferase
MKRCQIEAAQTGPVELPHWDLFRETAVGRYLLDREQAFIRRFLRAIPRPFRLLDVCCCAGRQSLPLSGLASKVVGLDIDLNALRVFRGRSGGHPAVRADGLNLPFGDGSFGCVVAIQCALYFDLDRLLRECGRVLREGGWLIFQVINRDNYKRRLKRLMGRPWGDHPSVDLSLEEVLRTAVACGFEVGGVEGYNWLPLVPDIAPLSDSRLLVSVASSVERGLRLGRFPRFSPWVLIAGRKSGYTE